MLKENDKAPQFTLPDQNNNNVSLSDYKGKWFVYRDWFCACCRIDKGS